MTNKDKYVREMSIEIRACAFRIGQDISIVEAKEIASIAFDILADNPFLRDNDWDIPLYAYRNF